jgi:hypothetical protein
MPLVPMTARASDATGSSWADNFSQLSSGQLLPWIKREKKRSQIPIETTEKLTGPARDLRDCSYNRQEGFEYLGATVGYISRILRNSHEISA